MNINEIRIDIFDQIKKTYQTINPTLSDMLTLDSLTGSEADSLEIQLKRIKKQHVGYLILTTIGFLSLTVFTIIGLVKSHNVSASLGLMAISTLTLLVLANKSRMFIKSIENQIFLHRLLNKIEDK